MKNPLNAMNLTLPENLGPYSGKTNEFAGWLGEALWGHRFERQSPWALTLEFLGMIEGTLHKGALFEPTAPEDLPSYQAPKSRELRILIFNNSRMRQFLCDYQDNDNGAWEAWFEDMKQYGSSDEPVDFTYLRKRIPTFHDLVSRIELVQTLALESDANRKPTQRLLFPIGPAALYEPSGTDFSRDRTLFTRTGEIAYLMLTRAKEELRLILKDEFTGFFESDTPRNKLILSLLPRPLPVRASEKTGTYLPYRQHPAYDRLAEDIINLLQLGLPNQDVIEHLRFILPFHLYIYTLETANHWLGTHSPVQLVCEIPGPKMDVVRRASTAYREENEAKGIQALRTYAQQRIDNDKQVAAIKDDANLTEEERAKEFRAYLITYFLLDESNQAEHLKAQSFAEVYDKMLLVADESYRTGLMPAIEGLGQAAGLIDSRGTIKKRYAPTDRLLRALVLANVTKKQEESDFLNLLKNRYGLIFAPKQADGNILTEFFDEADFKRNHERLTRRLVGLGLANSMSDACTYMVNPYSR
jgi:hypothetical protein